MILFTSFILFLRNSPYWMEALSLWEVVGNLILTKFFKIIFKFLGRSSFLSQNLSRVKNRCIANYNRANWWLFKHFFENGNNTGGKVVEKIGNGFLLTKSMKCLKFIFANDTKVKFLFLLVNVFLVQISPSEISARHAIIYNVILHKICITLLISCTISGPSTFLKPLVPEFGILPKLSLTF